MNKPIVLFLKGLPGSGKSTLARQLVSDHNYVRVNKDEIRNNLLAEQGGSWSQAWENENVIVERNAQISAALAWRRSVIVDDTNFAPIHEQTIRELAGLYDAQFVVCFIDTPLSECIRRDAARPEGERVGEAVIRKMASQYGLLRHQKAGVQG